MKSIEVLELILGIVGFMLILISWIFAYVSSKKRNVAIGRLAIKLIVLGAIILLSGVIVLICN